MTISSKKTAPTKRSLLLLRLGSTSALAVILTLGFGAAVARAEISVGLGGLGGVSIGHESGVRAGVGVGGVRAGASVGGGSVAGVGVSVGGASGIAAGVSVGGGTVAGVGVSVGGAAPGTPTTPGVTPPVVIAPEVTPVSVTRPATKIVPPPAAKMRCAKGGNSQVYNGLPVSDRNGTVMGWVHDTSLDQSLKIAGVSFQSVDNRCLSLSGGSYKLAGGTVQVNMDASRLR